MKLEKLLEIELLKKNKKQKKKNGFDEKVEVN